MLICFAGCAKIPRHFNAWLITLANEKRGFSSDMLFWIRQCEGGMTTQRIQDLLLLIRSYLYLLDHSDVQEIILLSHRHMQWEDTILMEAARSRGISVKVQGYNHINILLSNIRQYAEIIGRSLYYLYNFLRIKIGASTKDGNETSNKEIVFQLCSLLKTCQQHSTSYEGVET